MRRWLKRIGIAALVLAGCAVAFVLSGYLLPRGMALGVEERISAPPERVYPLLVTSEGIARWWTAVEPPEGYPKLEVRHTGGPTEGPGTQVAFGSGGMEFEWWTLTASRPPAAVEYDVDFGIFTVHRTITLTPDAGGTAVSWQETAELGNPLLRWMAWLSGSEGVKENFRTAIRALDAAAAE